MLNWMLERGRGSGSTRRYVAALVVFTAVGPAMAAAEGFDCQFTKLCLRETCKTLDSAPMRVRFLGLGDSSGVAAITLADGRLLQGPLLEEGDDYSSLFGDFEPGSHPTVQAIGTWINAEDDPRRDIVITFDGAVQLTVTPVDADNAVLLKEGRGLTALLGPTRTIGTCEVASLP